MNKSDPIQEVARVAGASRRPSERAVSAVFERITEALVKGERVELRAILNPHAAPEKAHA